LRRCVDLLTVDISSAPYVLHFWSGKPTDDDLVGLRGCLEWEAAQVSPLYCFVDLRKGAVPDAAVVRKLGALFREFEERRKLALMVVIVDSWLVVSLLNALRWISAPRTPEIFVRTAADALASAEPHLRAMGAPPIPAEVRSKLLDPDQPSTTWMSV
jgi:hypothetical protein